MHLYKAYDPTTGIMYDNHSYNILLHLSGEMRSIDANGYVRGLVYSPNLILIKCTGKKDKNGQEIYDKDILKDINGEYIVFWDDYMAGFKLRALKGNIIHDINNSVEYEAVGSTYTDERGLNR